MMQKIIDYLAEKYEPEAIVVYGSYADGTNNLASDFDALVLTEHAEEDHDGSIVDGVLLDVFLRRADAAFDPEDYVQLYDGIILLDRQGKAAALQEQVRAFIDSYPVKSIDEVRADVKWCEKMLLRTQRLDAEGYYRWHWLLCDSLQIYCDVQQKYYFGPKKTLNRMKREDPSAFRVYEEALKSFDWEKLAAWVQVLKSKC